MSLDTDQARRFVGPDLGPNCLERLSKEDTGRNAGNGRESFTLENHCTRTAQSSRGGCSRRVRRIVYLAVKKGKIMVNILLLKIFFSQTYDFHL